MVDTFFLWITSIKQSLSPHPFKNNPLFSVEVNGSRDVMKKCFRDTFAGYLYMNTFRRKSHDNIKTFWPIFETYLKSWGVSITILNWKEEMETRQTATSYRTSWSLLGLLPRPLGQKEETKRYQPLVLTTFEVSSRVSMSSDPMFSKVMVSCWVSPLKSWTDTALDSSSFDMGWAVWADLFRVEGKYSHQDAESKM